MFQDCGTYAWMDTLTWDINMKPNFTDASTSNWKNTKSSSMNYKNVSNYFSTLNNYPTTLSLVPTRKIPRVYPEFLAVSLDFPYFQGIFCAFQGFHILSQDLSRFPRGFEVFWRTKSILIMPYAHLHPSLMLTWHSRITLYAQLELPQCPVLTWHYPHNSLCSPGTPIKPYGHLHPSTIPIRHSAFITPYDFLSMRALSLRALKWAPTWYVASDT